MTLRLAVTFALVVAVACTPSSRGIQPLETTAATVAPLGRTQQQARVLITRASLEVEVEDVQPAIEQATRLTQAFEGYVENATAREDKNAYLRLRVPSSRLTEMLDSLGRLGKVTGRSLSEEDVTAQSVDLEARVLRRALRAHAHPEPARCPRSARHRRVRTRDDHRQAVRLALGATCVTAK
jgi:Domain of unknown function (DUF4349)